MTRDDPAFSKLAEAIRNESRLHPDTVRAALNALRPTLHGGTSRCGFGLHPLSGVKEVVHFDLENDSLCGPVGCHDGTATAHDSAPGYQYLGPSRLAV
jgi:hypothetical protein